MSVLIEARDLKKYYKNPRGMLHAVDGVSFTIETGMTLGVVGESGCGKTTLGRILVHLIESTGGSVFFDGRDVTKLRKSEIKEFRKNAQLVFQDPYASLDPRKTVRQIISEPFIISRTLARQEIRSKVIDLMELVGLAERFAEAYPHELDGGRRQRIGIARALALEPKFIVCDEPVSALDVSIQAQILNLLQDLQEKLELTYIFITHDLSVVEYISNDIVVMYLGQIVEKAPTAELFSNPLHPYTKILISAIPVPDLHSAHTRIIAKGEITSPINPDPGCRFLNRCHFAGAHCSEPQALAEIRPGHFVSCCKASELSDVNPQ